MAATDGTQGNGGGKQVESLLPYDRWTEDALRQVALRAVEHVAANGLPGGHHFYITFRTDHPATVVPPRLRTQYPQEMTIVLQHQFWDLRADPAAQTISVCLSFGGVPSVLVIPLAALTAFADPHVGYGMRFQLPAEPAAPQPAAEPPPPEPTASADEADEAPQVVSLDAFRRRAPPKE